jgi:hypothetical protein
MAIANKLTFVVVTCSKDLLLLSRYLRSLVTHCNRDDLEEVLLIFNDHYRYLPEFESVVQQFSMLPIRHLWSNSIWPEQSAYDWQSQQQLKIIAAELIRTEWYVINDSKDFYFGNLAYNDFVDTQGQSMLQALPIHDPQDAWFGPNSHHRSQYEHAYDFMGLRFTEHTVALRTREASVCPCHTHSVQNMITYLKQQCGALFPQLLMLQINHKAMFTEYALMSAWLEKNNLLLKQYRLHSPREGFLIKVSCNKDLRRGK